jgi:hypothetical protein
MNGLSVGDGFKFGCGFFIAGFVAWLVMVAIVLVLSLLFGATMSGILRNLGPSGTLLPMLWLI